MGMVKGGSLGMGVVRATLAVWIVAELWALGDAHGGADDDDVPEGVDLRAKGLILTKVYALIVVFFATFLAGVSPYVLRWNEAFLVLGTQFAGGVFLATAMIHFLADSHETFLDLRPSSHYAYAEMLAVVGYLLTMLADVVIQGVHRRGLKPTDVEDAKHSYQPDSARVDALENRGSVATANLGDALLLILALCFHSIFEGIAIGVAATKYDTWRALWTISLHKIFAAVAMGVALLRMLPNRPLLQCCLYAFAFAISTPVGVAIGIILDSTTEGHTADWIYAVSMGIATGIFVYVAINHLLVKGYRPATPVSVNTPFWRWAAVLLGATLISIVMIWD